MWTQIRLLLKEQSDQGPHCLPVCKNRFEKFARIFSRWHQTTFSDAGFLGILTLKVPRKTASENVVCLCRLLHLLANFSNLHFAYRQTVWTQIRLLHCLQKWLLKSQADDKADDNSCWGFIRDIVLKLVQVHSTTCWCVWKLLDEWQTV